MRGRLPAGESELMEYDDIARLKYTHRRAAGTKKDTARPTPRADIVSTLSAAAPNGNIKRLTGNSWRMRMTGFLRKPSAASSLQTRRRGQYRLTL